MSNSALVQLKAKINTLLEFRYPDEEEYEGERTSLGKRVAQVGAGTAVAGLGYGGYIYRNEIGAAAKRAADFAGGMASTAVATGKHSYGLAKKGYGAAASGLANSGVGQAFTKGFDRAGYAGEGRLKAILRGIRGAARKVTKGRSAMVGLSLRAERLVQLNAKLDQVVKMEA